MTHESEENFSIVVDGILPGDLYRYRMDGNDPWPDPASRFQPRGVHGPSQLVDTAGFSWSDGDWNGIDQKALAIYELHVGAFTREGTFRAAEEKLPYLRDLGITCVELMPVADFPGSRNWGYDGAALFAPARCYGTPQQLASFVNAAHRLSLAVHLDVVYNHLGPDGAYLAAFCPFAFSEIHRSPWGAGLNFDGLHSSILRDFFIDNALFWIHAYHFDGLRLDATHAIQDDSKTHFLAQLGEAVADSMSDESRKVLLIAEDERNLARIATSRNSGGYGLDGIWADDFHHQVHRCLTGQSDGYFADSSGSAHDIATTVKKGWFYCGQRSSYFGHDRGSDPSSLSSKAFIICLQNHDQVGNRAMGERLNHLVDLASYRAATVLLLLAPEIPLMFMGQEWAASSPFLYFTDHNDDLGQKVTEGRRREFARFGSFADPDAQRRIPDPQAKSTFTRSKLNWSELGVEPHKGILRLYQELLRLRENHPAMQDSSRSGFEIMDIGVDALLLQRISGTERLLAFIQLKGAATHSFANTIFSRSGNGRIIKPIITTEDPQFTDDPMAAGFSVSKFTVTFRRPGAVTLEVAPGAQQGGEEN